MHESKMQKIAFRKIRLSVILLCCCGGARERYADDAVMILISLLTHALDFSSRFFY